LPCATAQIHCAEVLIVIRNFSHVLLVLWAGSLWSLAIWVAPTLFYAQSDRHLAGVLAGRLFAIETYVGVGVAALAVLLPGRTRFVWGYLAVALLAINQWALRRVMDAAHAHGAVGGLTFGAWHGVSAVFYVLACLAVLRLIWNEDFR
jgi:hypothetical protein